MTASPDEPSLPDLPEPWCWYHDLPRFLCGCSDVSNTRGRKVDVLDVDWEYVASLAERGMSEPGVIFEARFEGTCPCGDRWSPGDLICWSRISDHLVHARCSVKEQE